MLINTSMLFGTIPKDTLNIVNTGIYITDLYDFDMINSSFSVNFWFWQKWDSKKILENDEVEFVNAKEKLELQCRCGNIFYKDWTSLCTRKQFLCPKCVKSKFSNLKKLNASDVFEKFKEYG